MSTISFNINNKDESGNCKESTWTDVEAVCDKCKVIANNMDDKYRTCDAYCETNGLQCKAAWEDTSDTCTQEREEDCNYDFGDETGDAICECIPKGGIFIFYSKVIISI